VLHFQIDFNSGMPVYRQIMDQVRYYVAAGQLKPEEQLPSIREMSRALRVNPTTIVKAYSELEHSGDINMLHGRGAFIARDAGPKSAAAVKREFHRLASPLAAAAIQMGLSAERAAELLREEIDRLNNGGGA
jgi:GntR family transcriptional regulator